MHYGSHFAGQKWNRVIDFFGDVHTLILTYSNIIFTVPLVLVSTYSILITLPKLPTGPFLATESAKLLNTKAFRLMMLKNLCSKTD